MEKVKMFDNISKERNIPKIWNDNTAWDKKREEIKEILFKEEYGYPPEQPKNVKFEFSEPENYIENFCAGKVRYLKMICKGEIYGRNFSFPFSVIIPKKGNMLPYFVHINFSPDTPDKYQPTEEITDRGFAIISFCYKDVTSDDNDFSNGVAGAIFKDKKRKPTDCGKIMIWAWAASLLRDYAQTLKCLDHDKCAVIGHSRTGKAALVAGMTDERFKIVISNNSGCSGAAISRNKIGEDIDFMTNTIPYWFCENYKKYARLEHSLPFDQHFLLASIAPRRVYVASAEEDLWADPMSEYLSCAFASEVYEKLGFKGFVAQEKSPAPGDVYHDGEIAYHLRSGKHYLSRTDWNYYMDYIYTL